MRQLYSWLKGWLNDFVHNAIVHPLMCFVPKEWGNRLHDWHATKVLALERYNEIDLEGRS